MNALLRGCITALVTPFKEGAREVDFASLTALLDYQLAAGVRGFVICGSTGEASTLRQDEYLEVIAHVVQRTKSEGVLCIAGVSNSSTERAVELAKCAAEVLAPLKTAAALLVSAPPYNKPSQAGIMRHIETIREGADLAVVAYNIPGRSAVNILPETLKAMGERRIIDAVKESSGNMEQVMDLLALTKGELAVLSGEDALVVPVLAAGGVGVISATANIAPRSFVELLSAADRGDFARARDIQLGLLPIIRACFCETNPVSVKAALKLKGVISSDAVRLPLINASSETTSRWRSLTGSDLLN